MTHQSRPTLFTTLLLCLLTAVSALLTSCANPQTANPADPYEPFNRAMFKFNDTVDAMVLRPIAVTYETLIPSIARQGVTNFFNNARMITVFPNDILQGKLKFAGLDLSRFLINIVLGVGGLFDIATRMGIPSHYNDFGLTLAFYTDEKYRTSPYIVWPFLGPSTLRETMGMPADAAASPWFWLPDYIGYPLYGLKVINSRALFLPTDNLLKTSFDPYVFVRNAYLQTRRKLIQDNDTTHKAATLELDEEPLTTISATAEPETTDTTTFKQRKGPRPAIHQHRFKY